MSLLNFDELGVEDYAGLPDFVETLEYPQYVIWCKTAIEVPDLPSMTQLVLRFLHAVLKEAEARKDALSLEIKKREERIEQYEKWLVDLGDDHED
jgi:hypothetical protein